MCCSSRGAQEPQPSNPYPDRSPRDAFEVSGTEIYLHYPNGAGRSKLSTDYFEKKLATRATARNWNTVTRVFELME